MTRDPSTRAGPPTTTFDPARDRGVVFVDADDTLWENNRYFLAVIREWTRFMAGMGIDAELARDTLEACEDRNIPVTGYGSRAFVHSLRDAFADLAPEPGPTAAARFAHLCLWCERGIGDHPILLLPQVESGLSRLTTHHLVVILTKGDPTEQRGKVARSGLADVVHGTIVAPEKHAGTYAEACERLAVPARRAWMIGNSPRSDVNPAREAGLRTILVPHESPWHRDLAPPLDDGPPTWTATSFGHAVDLVLGSE